ncbi:MAG: lytic transglycosylase domain-containing protein [Flavobacteriales bacterium]|nr:lytic transglycosylase domain-containing protein [Flavobacteriales bacterium]
MGILAAGVIYLSAFKEAEHTPKGEVIDNQYQEHVGENYKVFSLPTPTELTFCGETVPMEKFGVREKLDRELLVNTYWHSNTFLSFKRANRYFPKIEAILAEEGVPEDFKYLAMVESGLTNAVSPAGARGFWQFMKTTGRNYGLEINDQVDERYHLEKATRAACQYLKDSYEVYGDWALVAASYNMGVGGVNKQLKKQKVDSYWDLLLNEETGRYVYRILAVKEILNNSSDYGFVIRPKDLYEPYQVQTVAVDSAVTSWVDFAIQQGTTYNALKTLNPWIRNGSLSNKSQKTYEIQLPSAE